MTKQYTEKSTQQGGHTSAEAKGGHNHVQQLNLNTKTGIGLGSIAIILAVAGYAFFGFERGSQDQDTSPEVKQSSIAAGKTDFEKSLQGNKVGENEAKNEAKPSNTATTEAKIQAVLSQSDMARKIRMAYDLFDSDDEGVRTTALRRFYFSGDAMLQRTAIIYFLERTSHNQPIALESTLQQPAPSEGGSLAEAKALLTRTAGWRLKKLKVDRSTGAFTGRLGSIPCSGRVSKGRVQLTAEIGKRSWSYVLHPDAKEAVLRGKLTSYNGVQVGAELWLM